MKARRIVGTSVSRLLATAGRRTLFSPTTLLAAALAAAALLAPQAALAQTYTTWLGGSTNWGSANNWSNLVPSGTSIAEFNSTVSNQPGLIASSTADAIWVTTGVNQGVTISGAQTLNITGTATCGLNSDATAGVVLDDALNNNLTVTSGVTLINSQGFFVDNNGTLNFNTGAFNLNGKTLTLAGTGSSGTTILGGIVSGTTGSIIVNTSGIVTLGTAGGASNTFTGGVILNAGVLNISKSGALGTTAGTLSITGGTLDNTSGAAITTLNYPLAINGDFAFAGASDGTHDLNFGTGATKLGGAGTSRTITVNAGNLTLGGIIANGTTANSLIKAGAGALTLAGANTFTGGVTLNSGTLNLNAAKALGPAAAGPLVINGGTIDQTVTSVTLTGLPSSTTFGGNFGYGGTNNLNMGVSPITNAGNYTITLNGSGKTLTFGGTMSNTEGGPQTTTVNGAGNTLSLGGYNLSNSSTPYTDIIQGSGNVTITGIIADSNGGATGSGLTYNGNGALTLSGSNTFTGGVTLNSGDLNINLAGVAGTSGPLGNGDTFTINGGTIDNTSGSAKVLLNVNPITVTNNFVFNGSSNLTLPGTVDLSGGTQTITTSGGTLTLSGIISDGVAPGGITKSGTGALTLSNGLSTFTGGVTLTTGKLNINAAGQANTSGPLGNGGTFAINGGVIGNSSGGTVSVANVNPITVGGNFSTNVANNLTLPGNVDLGGAARTITLGGGASLILSGNITDGDLIVKGANGSQLNISGANTFTNGVTLNGGQLDLNSTSLGTTALLTLNGGIVNSTAGLTFGAGVTIQWSGTITFSGGAYKFNTSNGVTLTAATTVIPAGNSSVTVGAISGTGGLTVGQALYYDTSTLTISGASTYTGNTTITGGTNSTYGTYIKPDVNNALPYGPTAGNLNIQGIDAALNLNGFTININGLNGSPTLPGGAGSAAGNVFGGGALILGNNNANGSFGGVIASGLSLTKTGTGVQFLYGANSYTGGTTVNGGTLSLQGAGTLGASSGSLTINAGLLDLGGTSPTVAGFTGGTRAVVDNLNSSPVTLTVGNNGGSGIYSGVILSSSGAVALTKIGGGMVTLTASNNSYTGPTTVGVGILEASTTGSVPNYLGPGVLSVYSTFAVAVGGAGQWQPSDINNLLGTSAFQPGSTLGIDTSGGSFTYSGAINNNGLALAKLGANTLALSGSSTYTGGTTISSGTLVAANGMAGSATGTGSVTLNGGVLAAGPAGGTITGLVQPGSGPHTVAPGTGLSSGYGTLNLIGGLTTGASTTLAFNMNTTAISTGIYGGDLINLGNSALTVNGGSINVTFGGSLSPTVSGDYRLFENASIAGLGLTGFTVPAPNGWTYSLTTADSPYIDLLAVAAVSSGGTWTTNGSGSWKPGSNWSSNPTVPSAGTVVFAGTPSVPTVGPSAPITVTLDGPQSAGALVFNVSNTNGFTLSGAGSNTLTLGTSTSGASIAVLGGSHIIDAPVVLANALVVSGSGTLAFGSSSSITDNGSNYALAMNGPDGTLSLSGSDNYSGGTIVEAGTLIATDSNAIPSGSSLTVGAGGVFIFDPSQAVAGPVLSHDSSMAVAAVPEPGTVALLAAALWSAVACYRFSKRPVPRHATPLPY